MRFETIPGLIETLQSTELFEKEYSVGRGMVCFQLKGKNEEGSNIQLYFDVSRFYYNHGEVQFRWCDYACYERTFEEIFEVVIPEIQEKLIFHLDLFR